jgi:hypothetical protein
LLLRFFKRDTFSWNTRIKKRAAAEKKVEYNNNSITDKYLRDSLNAEATVDQENTTVMANK